MQKKGCETDAETLITRCSVPTIYRIFVLLFLMVIGNSKIGMLHAAILTWDNSSVSGYQSGDGNWETDAFWSADGITLTTYPNTNDTVIFSTPNVGNYSITLNSTVQVDSMLFSQGIYSINGGTINLGRGIYLSSGISPLLNTVISGTNGMSLYGSGTLRISKNNTYTGSTNIQGGYLQIGNGGTTGSVPNYTSITNNGGIVYNRTDELVMNNSISGSGTLQVLGTGTLVIAGYAMHAGATTISAGTLQIGNGSYDGELTGTSGVNVTGTLVFNRSGAIAFSAPIAGTGNLVQKGAGSVELTGANTFSGSTTVSRGKLKVTSGLINTSTVAVCSTGTLSGTGMIGGTASVYDGGVLMPGDNGTGKLTFANLQLDNTSIMKLDVGTVSDSIVVDGNAVIDGIINLTTIAGFAAGTYTLIKCTGTLTNIGIEIGFAPGGFTSTLNVLSDRVNLLVTADTVRTYTGAGSNHLWSNPANWVGNILPTSGNIVQFNVLNTICSLDVDVTVRSLTFAVPCSLALNHKKLTILKELDLSTADTIVSDIGDTILFSGSESRIFRPRPNTLLPVIVQNGTGVTYLMDYGCSVRDLIINGGAFDFGPWLNDTIYGKIKVNSGALHFNTAWVKLTGDADFIGADAIVNAGGELCFVGSGNQKLLPAAGKPHPAIRKSGTGTLTIGTNRLRTKALKIDQGLVNMDTALTTDSVYLQSSGILELDTRAGNVDTLNNFDGTGVFHVGSSTVFSKTTVRHHTLNALDGSGKICLYNNDSIDFQPKADYLYPYVEKSGSGLTRFSVNQIMAKRLDVINGDLKFTMNNDSVIDTISISGGTLRVGTGIVKVGNMYATGGTLHFGMGTLLFRGKGCVDLSGLSALYPDTGTIVFSGDGASAYHYHHPVASVSPVIRKWGKSTDTLLFINKLHAKSIIQDTGIVIWSDDVTHEVDTLRSFRGEMYFGNCTLSVEKGDVQFGGIDILDPGTALLKLNATTGIQHLYASGTQTLPMIKKTGSAGMMLMLNSLMCKGLTVEAGNLDFAGYNIDVDGQINIVNGTSTTFTGLAGRTLSSTGSIYLKGQTGNLLNLDPASAWTVTSPGTIVAEYASIGYSTASSQQGIANGTCVDNGNNNNWIIDNTAPTGGISFIDGQGYTNDADPPLSISHTGADSMRIGPTESMAQALPWKAVSALDSIDISVGGEGGKSAFIQFKDLAGNISVWYSAAITFDLTAPNGSLVISDRGGFTSDITPALTITASGSDSMRIALPGDSSGSVWKVTASTDSIDISGIGEGQTTICVQLKDKAGNRTSWYTATSILDITNPAVNVIIRDRNGYTNDSDPAIIVSGAEIDSIRWGFGGDSTSYVWKDSLLFDSVSIAGGGEGKKYLYAQVMDRAGNRSSWYIDSTILDVTEPSGAVAFTNTTGFTNDSDPAIELNCTGADSMRLGSVGDTALYVWKVYSTLDSTNISGAGEGSCKVYVQIQDVAGNRSNWCILTTVYDITAPASGIVINDNANYTNDNTPAMTIGGSGIDSIRLSMADDSSASVWKAYTSLDSIDISAGGEGAKQICLQTKDIAGNLSPWVSAITNYDMTSPDGSFLTDGNYSYETWDGIVSGGVSDALSGVDSVKVEIMNELTNEHWNGSSWQNTLTTINLATAQTSWSVALPVDSLKDAPYLMSIIVKDVAGNESSPISGVFTFYSKPVADFTADILTGNPPLSVTFTSAPSGNIQDYEWDFGDGTTGNGDVFQHTYQASGRFTVTLRVTGPGGADTLVRTQYINIGYDAPVAQFIQTNESSTSISLIATCTNQSSGIIDSVRWIFGDGTTIASNDAVHEYLVEGSYQIKLKVWGPGGVDSILGKPFNVVDTISPQNVEALSAVSVNCSTLIISWMPSAAKDIDSIAIVLSDTGINYGKDEGKIRKVLGASETSDTLKKIPAEWALVHVSAFTKDISGNWSSPYTGAMSSMGLPDCSPPEHNLIITSENYGDTVVSFDMKSNPALEMPHYLDYGIGSSADNARISMQKISYRDTIVSIATAQFPGWLYLSTSVADQAGNRSSVRIDSIFIKNLLPEITLLKDVNITEGDNWMCPIVKSDRNGDSVTLSILKLPEGATYSAGMINFTPDDNAVGLQNIIISATDVRGGTAVDTFIVTVVNKEEPPSIALIGDSNAVEDIEWQIAIKPSDEDAGDSVKIVVNQLPQWAVFTDGKIRGTPKEGARETDTIRIEAVDKTGLGSDTILPITVTSINDIPVIVQADFSDLILEKDTVVAYLTINDPDRYDSLSLSIENNINWVNIRNKEYDASTGTTKFTLMQSPQQRDTGSLLLRIKCKDRAGEAALFEHRMIIVDRDDPPQPPSITIKVAFGALQCKVTSVDDYDTELTYELSLKSMNNPSFIRNGRNENGTFNFYPLLDDVYIVEVCAIDKAGGKTGFTKDTAIIKGASVHVSSDTLWEMISIPGTYDIQELDNTEFLLHWDESKTEKQLFHYYQVKSEIDTILPGKGYWRKGLAKDTFKLTADQLPTTPVLVQLHHTDLGWNQISSPYPYPVVWKHPHNGLWKWNAKISDFVEVDSVLEPWEGYWVQVDSSDTVIIDTVPWFKNTALSKKKQTRFSDENDWVFNLSLVSENGNDRENRFGFSAQAEDGFDTYDRIEPPRIMGKQSLSFHKDNLKKGFSSFASDIRKTWKPINVFEFALSEGEYGSGALLNIEGYTEGTPIFMYFVNSDTATYIEPGVPVTITKTAGLMYKTLFVVKDPSLMQRIPLRFSFSHPYPNPCGSHARVEYTLPYRWNKDGSLATDNYNVSMVVYDLKGRKVKTLVNEMKTPGTYHILWDGTDKNHKRTASGHYFIRLKTASFESIRKLIMVH